MWLRKDARIKSKYLKFKKEILNDEHCKLIIVNTQAYLQEGKPPPKNMLNRSSGVMSASKPLWKSKPPPCEWPGLLCSSPPVRSYCRLLSGLLSTAYALPISEWTTQLAYQRQKKSNGEQIFLSFMLKAQRLRYSKLDSLFIYRIQAMNGDMIELSYF